MAYNPSAQAGTPQIFSAVSNLTGLPLAGGQLYTYISGTTTPQATYTDNTLTIQCSNPIILDNYGQAIFWLSSGSPYRFNLLDASGVQQAHYPMDNIQQQTLSTVYNRLSDTTTSTNAAGMVAYNPSIIYPSTTVGSNLAALNTSISNLALNTSSANGAGLVGWSSSNGYSAGTVGNNLNTLNTNFANLALNTNSSNGAGMVGFSALNTYSPGTVGYILNNVPAFVGQSKFNFTPSTNASPTVGDVWYSNANQSLATAQGASGSPVACFPTGILSTSTAPYSITFATGGTYQSLLTGGTYSNTLTLPANFFVSGKMIKIEMWVDFTNSSSANQLQFQVYLGSTICLSFGFGVTLPASVYLVGKIEAIVESGSACGIASFSNSSTNVAYCSGSHGTSSIPSTSNLIDVRGEVEYTSGVAMTIFDTVISIIK